MKNPQQINDHVSKIRGVIIHHCTYVEKMIDEAISRYFCNNIEIRQDLLNFLLCTERITFSNKLQIFDLIVQKEKSENYLEFKRENPKYNKELNNVVIEERNVLAHYLYDSSSGFEDVYNKEKKIRFIKFKVSKENPNLHYVEYDDSKLESIVNTIRKYEEALLKLNKP